MNEVLKNWFKREPVQILGGGRDYPTPLVKAYYNPHHKSRMEEPTEPHLKYIDQAVEHLQAKEYTDVWAIWLECKRLVKSHLGKVLKIWEYIEEKLVAGIPSKFTEWDARGINPPDCYILDNTVWEIYREAEYFKATGKIDETSFKKDTEQDYFRVGISTLYAKSHDESIIDDFIKVALEIVTDQSLIEQLKVLDAEKETIDDLIEKFKQTLDKIIDDFEKGHVNLKGTCWRCKDWHNEVVSLR